MRTSPSGLLAQAVVAAERPKHEPSHWRDVLRDASAGTALKYAKAVAHTNAYSAAGLLNK